MQREGYGQDVDARVIGLVYGDRFGVIGVSLILIWGLVKFSVGIGKGGQGLDLMGTSQG